MNHVRQVAVAAMLAAQLLAPSITAPVGAVAAGLNCADPFICYALSITFTGDGSGTITSADGHINCVVTDGQPAASGCSWKYRTLLTNPTVDVDLHSQEAVGNRVCFLSKSDSALYRFPPNPLPGDCSPYRTDPAAPSDRLTPLFLTLSGSATVEYEFDAEQEGLVVFLKGTGSGAVTSKPTGITCGAGACGATFAYGQSVTLTAIPGVASVFHGWSGFCSGLQAICTTTITGFTSMDAVFDLRGASPTPTTRPTARPAASSPSHSAVPSPAPLATPIGSDAPSLQSAAATIATTGSAGVLATSSPGAVAPAAVSATAGAAVDVAPIGIGIAIAGVLIALAILGVGLASRRSRRRSDDARP
jgi:hypothetical protein